MLIDNHGFLYRASVPWPMFDDEQLDWEMGVKEIHKWLDCHVGHWMHNWAWDDGSNYNKIGVAFRWNQDRMLFLLAWS